MSAAAAQMHLNLYSSKFNLNLAERLEKQRRIKHECNES